MITLENLINSKVEKTIGIKYGVVGSGKYKDKKFVIEILENTISKEHDIIVSGHSPRNEKYDDYGKKYYNNVDNWAEDWANEFCWNKPIIHHAIEFTDTEFFRRNKKVARDSNKLIAFINRYQYISGTWNTIKYFINKLNFNYSNLIIYNEYHFIWNRLELPQWVRNKIKNMR